jgi:hypothetical protein
MMGVVVDYDRQDGTHVEQFKRMIKIGYSEIVVYRLLLAFDSTFEYLDWIIRESGYDLVLGESDGDRRVYRKE